MGQEAHDSHTASKCEKTQQDVGSIGIKTMIQIGIIKAIKDMARHTPHAPVPHLSDTPSVKGTHTQG